MSYLAISCPDEARWLEVRMQSVGASEAAAALGLSPYLSRYALWARKTRRSPPEDTNERMLWGRVLEAPIAEEYARRTGRKLLDPGRWTIMRLEGSRLSCTVDRFIEAFDSRGLGLLEVKNLGVLPERDWEEGGPLIYQIQTQAQMAVTDALWAVLCPLVGGNRLRPMDAYRDKDFISTLLEGIEEFWWFVEKDKAPPVDGEESTHEALQDLRRGRKELREVPLGIEAQALAMQFDMAVAKAEEAKALKAQSSADLKDLMLREGAEIGRLPDGSGFKWSPVMVKAGRCPNCGHETRVAHEREGFSRVEAK